ncbi:Imm50 family immunity protein [Mesorhizobium sp. MSK_1335]|uniref:Imm50 family immunity protein n=1 Tax=Mesorhizobium montanum TaxID=3072323 RepID=A0ABU4ZLV8_9HYPH|nr:Imm50 family immunity protein [Mesorhizobium sp. MSK_1335]MDX8524996.1 Imm50 family immunity protein [Mesorhizobium sp. MSK_1335]
MEEVDAFVEIEGAKALIDWLGFVPSFHDARLIGIELSSNQSGWLRLEAFRMTDKIDKDGYFILDRHVLVTLTLGEIKAVSLDHFTTTGIVGHMRITRTDKRYRIAWDSSYGVEGSITAKSLRIDFVPSHPEPAVGEVA